MSLRDMGLHIYSAKDCKRCGEPRAKCPDCRKWACVNCDGDYPHNCQPRKTNPRHVDSCGSDYSARAKSLLSPDMQHMVPVAAELLELMASGQGGVETPGSPANLRWEASNEHV